MAICHRCFRQVKWWADTCGWCRLKEKIADDLANSRSDNRGIDHRTHP